MRLLKVGAIFFSMAAMLPRPALAVEPCASDPSERVYVMLEDGATVQDLGIASAMPSARREAGCDIPELGVVAYHTPGSRAVLPLAMRNLSGAAASWRESVFQMEPWEPVAADWREGGGVVFGPGDPGAYRRDPFYTRQWAIEATNADLAWAIEDGYGVVAGVVDTGVDCSHPDLLCTEREYHYDATTRQTMVWDRVTDVLGHGTHVAGTIAAIGGNGKGVVGMAPNAEIISARACSRGGRCAETDITAAIVYLWERADVINLSLGGSATAYTAAMCEAIDKARTAYGVTVVASVGNGGPSSRQLYPATCPGVIGVAATTGPTGRKLASYSQRASVDISAPGSDIISSVPGGGWAYNSGTSMAAPHVTGAAALLLAHRPGLEPFEVANALQDTADEFCGPVYRATDCGHGALDIDAALRALMPFPATPTDAPDATADPVPDASATLPIPTPTLDLIGTAVAATRTAMARSATSTATSTPAPLETPVGASLTPTVAVTATVTATPCISNEDCARATLTAEAAGAMATATFDAAVRLTVEAGTPTPTLSVDDIVATAKAAKAARYVRYFPALLWLRAPEPTATPDPCALDPNSPACARARATLRARHWATDLALTATAGVPTPTPRPTRMWPLGGRHD